MFGSLFGIGQDLAAFVLRMGLGIAFVVHGYPKLGKKARKGTGDWLKSMGIPAIFGLVAGVAEFFGGIALLVGFLTPVVAALFVVWMLALIWLSIAKIKKKFVGGWELDFLLLISSLALATLGSGLLSLDHLLGI
jgi:putative oxidoreductase